MYRAAFYYDSHKKNSDYCTKWGLVQPWKGGHLPANGVLYLEKPALINTPVISTVEIINKATCPSHVIIPKRPADYKSSSQTVTVVQ